MPLSYVPHRYWRTFSAASGRACVGSFRVGRGFRGMEEAMRVTQTLHGGKHSRCHPLDDPFPRPSFRRGGVWALAPCARGPL
mmetsp:Transcript_614/g.1211  ORF Transcript_614/g.1211 Transcript_614/m.1211 type:complete len:82 (-) Transcript_614:653-898(-)